MKKTSPAKIKELVDYARAHQAHESIRGLADRFRMAQGTINKILIDKNIELETQRQARLRRERPHYNQPTIDIRGVYISADVQIIVLAIRSLDASEIQIEKIIKKPEEELSPMSYFSAGQHDAAELCHLLESRWDGTDVINRKTKDLCPTDWFTKIEVACDNNCKEELIVLVEGSNYSDIPVLDHPALLDQIECIDYSLFNAIGKIMTDPRIAMLEASTFPSLALLLKTLRKGNMCKLTPQHTTYSINLRLECAKALEEIGLKFAAKHDEARESGKRNVKFKLSLIKNRKRKQLLERNNEILSPFLPIKIEEAGARVVEEHQSPASNLQNYILYPELLRSMILTPECLEFIQDLWMKAQNTQKIFLAKNQQDPLIDCARLLGPEVTWLSTKEALNKMLLHTGGDPLIKPKLLSSLLLTFVDSSVFITALEQRHKSHMILEKMRGDYMDYLERQVFRPAEKQIMAIQHRYYIEGLDKENIIAQLKADFLIKECGLLLQRAFELITKDIQLRMSLLRSNPVMDKLIKLRKRTCLRSANTTQKELKEYTEFASQSLENNKEILFPLFLEPWPAISFDRRLISNRFSWHLKGIRDEMMKIKSHKEEHLDTTDADPDNDHPSKTHHPGSEDAKLEAASGSGKMNLASLFSALSPEMFHAKLLDLEKLVAADPKIPAELIALAEETEAEFSLLQLILDYFEALKQGNIKLINLARNAFEQAIFPDAEAGR